ncbi:hypothetical protein [Amycolatopsis sp. GA6-003]|uniref:hypothetical protein n=1 Tax=Amycolatopsis sp. GA6-003 TaxID=2652444 RepID=UPI003916F779
MTDEQTTAEAVASYVTGGPEQLLEAITRITLFETDAQTEFEAEPDVFRWFFHRHPNAVAIRLAHAVDSTAPQHAGTVIWHSEQPKATLAKAALRAFDALVADLGEVGYEAQWGRPFPRHELEAFRAAWRTNRVSDDSAAS